MAKDKDGNDIPDPKPDGEGQETPEQKQARMETQLADLIAAQKKMSADNEVMREENQRLQQMLVSMREHPGDGSGDTRRTPPRGSGRFSDPATRSEFERQYSLPAEAADVIIEEALSRSEQRQQERDAAIRNAESLKKAFFDDYPDLKDHLPIVSHFSDRCTIEHPNWTIKQGFVEVARLSREYIKSKLNNSSGRDEPPPVLSGGSGSQGEGSRSRLPGSDETPARAPTQDEEIKAEMDSRRSTRSKAL